MINIKSRQIARQFEKPSGVLGNIASKFMVKGNSSLYDTVVDDLKNNDQQILEIGFGPGVGIKKILSRHDKIEYEGIDFSELMVKQAKALNKPFITNNRLHLIHADFMEYSFSEKRYDVIIAINVIYFWASIEVAFNKVFNILNNHGLFILFLVEPEELTKIKFTRTDVFNKYEKSDVETTLKKAGFTEIEKKINIRNNREGYFLYAHK